MTWPEITLTDWDDFLRITSHLEVGGPSSATYMFRGQPNAADSLKPSILRLVPPTGASRDKIVEIEARLLREFKGQAHLHLSAANLPNDAAVISWCTLMQHYGAPTRLLDWTKSPFVAAYFAVLTWPDAAGAVWLFHAHSLDTGMQQLSAPTEPFTMSRTGELFLATCDAPYLFLLERLTKTERMLAQQGGFTLACDVLADHAELLHRVIPANTSQELIRKVVIPARLKRSFLQRLRRMNVTASALFPGADGLGRSIAELAALELLA
jgi:hypothetical protein